MTLCCGTASFFALVSPLFYICPFGTAYHIIEAYLIIVCQRDEVVGGYLLHT